MKQALAILMWFDLGVALLYLGAVPLWGKDPWAMVTLLGSCAAGWKVLRGLSEL